MAAWTEIKQAGQLKPGEMTHQQVGETDVLVLNLNGEFRAFVNRCGHMNAPLDLGTFKGGALKCPQHNAVFDARTGEVRGPPVLAMPGVDFSKLPPAFMEAMARMAPVFERVPCNPLIPLPVDVNGAAVRVWA